jgi:hypothetical protein
MLFGGLAVVGEAVLRDRTRGVWALGSVYLVKVYRRIAWDYLWNPVRRLFLYRAARC